MNARMMMTLLSVVGLGACGDNQLGEGNALRFGLVVQYAETEGFARIARGQAVPLALQAKEKPALLNDYPFVDGTLTITDPSGAAVPLERTAQGKFKTTFTRAGTHLLRAEANGVTDSLSVEVVEPAALRLARVRRSINTKPASGTNCTTGLADNAPIPQLKRNQSLNAAVVATDAAGNPLLGVLELDVSGPVTVDKHLDLIANTFTFTPTATGLVTLRIADVKTPAVTELTFEVTEGDATCPTR